MFTSQGVLEPGMSVQVFSFNIGDPLLIDYGNLVNNAFLRIYGIDLKQANALNGLVLESKRIG
ncbi:MAG: hypothetical protein IKQ46_10890 [Bacteroidales bacterium]|nr:hypothetical protein [Bacteroidales bacterium]